jgi:acetyl-CoA carboxylase biotin carboxylase subunit
VAKVIVWAEDRPSAINRMSRALSEMTIAGVKTTVPFHQKVMEHPAFRDGDIFTDFVARHMSGTPK